MRRFVVLLSLLSAPLFAQWNASQDRLDRAEMLRNPIIVEFRDPPLCERRAVSAKAAKTEYEAMFRRFRSDLKSSSNITHEYYELFNGVALTASAEDMASIRQLSYVKAIYPDFPVHALATPAAPANIQKIRADQVWSTYGSRGSGVTVAIIDTGVDYTHPALGGGFGPGHKVIGGWNFVGNNANPMDDNLHGTHVAGIIAGNSDQLLGVAPDASILAFKVLNAQGSGKTSDVLAGIERAADPNNDGDFSDHADVANLSLGGLGNPDDPQSVAIDRGTELGVVYCVAAGNSGSGFHTVASPGNARSAITVGATDINDAVASFSSRGPNTKDAALKPDVLAPGVSIVSSLPGGKYGPLSGTSMATPHIAGVAALVKAVHRDWTAEQIKSAIIDTATFLNQDIMTQGGGRVDALSAAGAGTIVTPGSISLGEDRLSLTKFSASSVLHVVNFGSQSATYTIGTSSNSAVTISAVPSQVRIDPGSSADITLNYTVTNGLVTPGGSLAFGGVLTITNSATPEVTRVPWAALKAARVMLSYDKPVPLAWYVDATSGVTVPALPIDATNQEAFLRGGGYDVVVAYEQLDIDALINNGIFRDSDVRLHYLDNYAVADDASLQLKSSSATHAITFDGQNETGAPVVGENYNGYASTGRIVFPAGSKLRSLILPAFASRLWHVTDITQKLLLQELNFNFINSNFYLLQHVPLDGVTSDVTLTVNGSDLKRVGIAAALAPATSDQRVVLFVLPIVPTGDATGPLGLVLPLKASFFNMSLFINPDTDPSYSIASAISSITDGTTRFATPQLRIVNGVLVSAINGTVIEPWSYQGDSLIFGNGLHYPRVMMVPTATGGKPNLFTDFVGQLGETRLGDRPTTVTNVYGADASLQATGSTYPMPLDLTQGGPFTITAVDSSSMTPTIPRKSTVTMALDSSRGDYVPPSFTTLMLLDSNGRIASHLDSHGGGSIVFGATDYAYATNGTRTNQSIAGEKTKAWYRKSGSQQWQPLTLTQLGEDDASGIVYRADMGDAANADDVLLDLRLDIADAAGNTTSFVMEPAFAVGRDSFIGRRSPHR